MTYEVDSLPALIEIGVQSEKGVRDVPFHVKSWMDEFDGIQFEVMVTPAGAKAAHPAASTLVGDVLYWHVSDSDTICSGEGKVEILGHLPDKRKLSGWAATKIRETSTLATAEPPETERPYYEAILEAADRIERALIPDAFQSDMSENNAAEMSFVRNRTHYDVVGQNWPKGTAVDESAPSAEIHKADSTLGALRWVKVGHAPEAESLVGHCNLSDVGMVAEENILDRGEGGYLLGREYESTSTTGVTRMMRLVSAVVCLKAGYSANGWPLAESLDSLSTATLPEPGLYLPVRDDGTVYRGFEIPAYTKPLEDRFIPPTVTRNSEVLPLVSSERINGLIDDKLHMFGHTVINLPETVRDNGTHLVLQNPWTTDIRANRMYNILYNGKLYRYTSVPVPESPVGALILGNGKESGMPDLNPDAPFAVTAVSSAVGAQIGQYGTVTSFDGVRPFTISIREADNKGYYYFDGSIARMMSIEELRQRLVDVGQPATLLAETTVQGEEGMMYLFTPLTENPEANVVHTVTYNGTAYDCTAIPYSADGMTGTAMGNTDVLGISGGNPDAPFALLLVSGGTDMGDGVMTYGMIVDTTGASSATLSIVKTAGNPGDALMTRKQVVALIEEMLGQSGETATDQVFYTADGSVFHTVDDAVLHVRKGDE